MKINKFIKSPEFAFVVFLISFSVCIYGAATFNWIVYIIFGIILMIDFGWMFSNVIRLSEFI